jgi:hypothetical protein
MEDESKLKSKLMLRVKERLPGFVALRHEDVRSSGHPDISMTGFARTSWWEAKHGTPDFESQGIQELTMRRLAAAGYARYIVWEERRGIRRTLIVHPKHIGTDPLIAEASCVGFDHDFVIDCIRKAHNVR